MGRLYQWEKSLPQSSDSTFKLPTLEGIKNFGVTTAASALGAASGIAAAGRASFGVQAADTTQPTLDKPLTGKSPVAAELSSIFGVAESYLSKKEEQLRQSPSYKPELNVISRSDGTYDWSKLKNTNVLLGELGTAFGSMIPIFASAFLTKGGAIPTVGTATLMEKGSAVQDYEQSIAQQRGIDVKDLTQEDKVLANKSSTAYGLVAGALESILPRKVINSVFGTKAATSLINRILINAPIKALEDMAIEGSTEALQQYAQNVIAKLSTIDPNRKLSTGVIDSAIGGALGGATVGAIEGVSPGKQIPVAPVTGETKQIEKPKLSVQTTPQDNFTKILPQLSEKETAVLTSAVSTPVAVENVQQLTPAERQVLGVALTVAKEIPGADIKTIDTNIKMIESTGVKVPETQQIVTPKTPIEQKPIPTPATVEKPVLPAEKPVTKKEVKNIVEEAVKAPNKTFITEDVQGNKVRQQFIRLANKKEQRGGVNRTRGFQSIPEKQGYEIVYKPYGENGAGYYYSQIVQPKTAAKRLEAKPKQKLVKQPEILTTIFGTNGKIDVTEKNYAQYRNRLTVATRNRLDALVKTKATVKKKIRPVENEKEYRIFSELETAQAGNREYIEARPESKTNEPTIIGHKSTFPQWVPEEYRKSSIIKPVLEHITNGTLPKTQKQIEFYNLLSDKLGQGKPSGPSYSFLTKRNLDGFLTEEYAQKLIREIEKETNPNIRAVLQYRLYKTWETKNSNGGTFYNRGVFDEKEMTISMARDMKPKEFKKVLRHEIRHSAFSLMSASDKMKVVRWYKSLNEKELIAIFGTQETLDHYRDTYRGDDMKMADEVANWNNDTQTNRNPISDIFHKIVRLIVAALRSINSYIFKKTQARMDIEDLYKDVFSQTGGENFARSPGYMEYLKKEGHVAGRILLDRKIGDVVLMANVQKKEGSTEKMRPQELFNSAWKKLYGVDAPKHLYSLLNVGFHVGSVTKKAFIKGKQVERSKTPALRAKVREENALKVREIRTTLRKMYKDKTATAQEIKAKVVEYVKANIPLSKRGQYLIAVKNSKNATHLSKVIASVDAKRAQYERSKLVNSINNVLENIDKLPVDLQRTIISITSQIELKKHTKRLLKRLHKTQEYLDKQANDYEMPRRVLNELGILKRTPFEQLSTQKLIDINNRLQQYNLVGRNIMKDKLVLERKEMNDLLSDLEKGSINLDVIHPDEKLNTFVRDNLENPEETTSLKEKAKNNYDIGKDRFSRLRIHLIGIDRLFNLLDNRADYTGPNYRIFKEPIDELWNQWQSSEDRILMSFYKMINELKLTKKSSERIAIYAYNQQRGGRKKLLEDRKFTEEQIDAIVLNKKEKLAYDFMRQNLDDVHEALTKKMEKENNVILGRQENYFPMLTDYGVTKPLLEEMQDMSRLKTVPFGSIQERKENAHQVLKLDAFQVFDSYIGKATYFMTMDFTLSRLNKLASSETYRKSIGENAQRAVLEWLDVLARKGGAVHKETTWEEKLNHFNNNLSVVVLGLRITTMAKQPLALLDGAAEIGAYAFRGTKMILDEDWRGFMRENSSEMRNRSGGDIAFERIIHDEVMPRIQDRAMYPIKFLDFYTAGAVWVGAYTKKMDELGLAVDFKKPNKEALAYANLVVRKTQASGSFKDLPLAVVNEYRTISKLFFKFQTFILNRWSYLSEDLPDKMKHNKKLAVQQLAFLSLSAMLEAGISSVYYSMLYGGDDDKKESKASIAVRSILSSFIQTVPFLGQLIASLNYGTTPVPLIEIGNKFFDSLKSVKDAKKMQTKEKHALRAAAYAFGVYYGIPTSQAQQLLEKWLFPSK